MEIKKQLFGQTKTGEAVFAFTLKNQAGTKAVILTYGAAVQSLEFAGVDVILGYDTMPDYEAQDKYMGAVAGRFANRIGGGRFQLNGTEYTLCCNDGANHLHGGICGFDKKVWTADVEEDTLCMRYTSPNGEEGYPGTLCTEVRYHLDEENQLQIEYQAICDTDTVLNLTNHSYFNLNGHGSGTLQGQEIQIFADFYTENDTACLPTGVIASVADTPMDFRQPHEILERIDTDFVQLRHAGGYDHNWIPNCYVKEQMRKCAEVYARKSGIRLAVFSDQPGIQFYTGNFLDGIVKGKKGASYPRRSGFCLETQGFPNAPNYGHFPSTVLRQGEWFRSRTVFAFTKEHPDT